MALGEELRKARLGRKRTCSEVAAATRVKVQVLEDLENERFDRIAAPVYGKGFLRIYAEHLGLDPRPLIEEFVSKTAGERPALRSDVPMRKPAAAAAAQAPGAVPPSEAEQREFFPAPDAAPKQRDAGVARALPPRRRVDLSGFASRPPEWMTTISGAAGTGGKWAGGVFGRCGAASIGLFRRTGSIRWTPSKIAAAVLVSIFILVLVISAAARTVGCSARHGGTPAANAREPLVIAAEPPEPYAD